MLGAGILKFRKLLHFKFQGVPTLDFWHRNRQLRLQDSSPRKHCLHMFTNMQQCFIYLRWCRLIDQKTFEILLLLCPLSFIHWLKFFFSGEEQSIKGRLAWITKAPKPWWAHSLQRAMQTLMSSLTHSGEQWLLLSDLLISVVETHIQGTLGKQKNQKHKQKEFVYVKKRKFSFAHFTDQI